MVSASAGWSSDNIIVQPPRVDMIGISVGGWRPPTGISPRPILVGAPCNAVKRSTRESLLLTGRSWLMCCRHMVQHGIYSLHRSCGLMAYRLKAPYLSGMLSVCLCSAKACCQGTGNHYPERLYNSQESPLRDERGLSSRLYSRHHRSQVQ